VRKILLCGVAALALAGCSGAKIGPGEEGVAIKQPVFIGSGGVDPTPLKTGRTYVAWTTKVVRVNMQPIQQHVEFDDLMSSDGVPLGFDAVMRFRITDSVRLIKDYGVNWYASNVEAEFRNRVRQAVRKHGMNETAIDTTAIDAIDAEVTQAMEQYIRNSKLPIVLLKITVGKANPPDSIKNQRIETAKEQQRKLTMDQSKLAEDARFESETSRAKADNAYRANMQLDSNDWIKLRELETLAAVCGDKNCTFVTSGATPLVQTR
jgi:regulator of protease activity HflC (stomatin/prohibitin superfamily)